MPRDYIFTANLILSLEMSYLLQFRAARQHIHLGNVHPSDSIRWKLYALAKQATEGDVKTGPPPR